MSILSIENLRKDYGKVQALKGVSFEVPKGTVFGILGPNGSGKTTMLGIITDILRPTAGTYRLFDEVPTEKHRNQIGTFLETPQFLPLFIRGKKFAHCCSDQGPRRGRHSTRIGDGQSHAAQGFPIQHLFAWDETKACHCFLSPWKS